MICPLKESSDHGKTMLKITKQRGAEDSWTLVLEGRLAGPWVEELQASWHALPENEHNRVIIQLADVTYIDADGKALLSRLWRQGAELRASGCLTRCVVEEIRRNEPGHVQ